MIANAELRALIQSLADAQRIAALIGLGLVAFLAGMAMEAVFEAAEAEEKKAA